MAETDTKHGHRERLRQRFLSNPESFSDVELIELILTYAIPRRDAAPLAEKLLSRFTDIAGIFSASYEELCNVDGVGEQAAILINTIDHLFSRNFQSEKPSNEPTRIQKSKQPKLFEIEPELGPLFKEPKETPMRTFANDEIANSLRFIPETAQFDSIESFKNYLTENLPYNSISTRQRRANYIINRYFPHDSLDTPLVYFASNCESEDDLKTAIFYQVLKAEPIATKAAEELIWPAVPKGAIEREELRGIVLKYLPGIGSSSQKNTLRSIFYTYSLLGVGKEDDNLLRIRMHTGTLEGFLYILISEFPKPGIYSFEALYNGPMRHWLLWDKEWIRKQLYNLQDYGIIVKISEIDTVRQFTTQYDQMTALRTYFEHPQKGSLSIRESEI